MISVLDMFTIGIGPSSSHTVGPMRAARAFVNRLMLARLLDQTRRIRSTVYGSLALTGKGHGVDKAILLGLEGYCPEEVPIDEIDKILDRVRSARRLHCGPDRSCPIAFNESDDLRLNTTDQLPRHSNGMRFEAFDTSGSVLLAGNYYSIGGGFVLDEDNPSRQTQTTASIRPPFAFGCGDELLRLAQESGLSISQMTLQNEACFRPESQIRAALLRIWQVMQECVRCGCHAEGPLPGGLILRRRAPGLYRTLAVRPESGLRDPLTVMDWISLYAMAVNEENASGHRVVTAPTNGAAGIIPAVLHYLAFIHGPATDDQIVQFLLTAGTIGILYKINASISGAEVGCQGEIGVACSMAAGALAEAMGGTPPQVEEAAEIGMEHNLGLTCDPVAGLVQVPCIERNAMGAVKAINAARLALHGDGKHRVSLDKVIATMRQTGADMSSQYKETALGGLAVNVPVC